MKDKKAPQQNNPDPAARNSLRSNSPNSKRNSNVELSQCTESNKRPKVVINDRGDDATDDVDAKAIVTPTESAAKENDAKPAAVSTSTGECSASTETLDLAESVGLKPGDQIEVQWEIHNSNTDASEENEKLGGSNCAAASSVTEASVSVHWWKATLLEFDGRTTDSVAVRSLLYEARPDLGFPEPSKEDVVFLGSDVLVTSTDVDSGEWERNPDSVRQMPYRRIQGQEVYSYTDDQLDEQLNNLLLGAFQKNQTLWNAMSAAQKAIIAEQVRKKKEKLKKALQDSKHKVFTSETIKEILAKTF